MQDRFKARFSLLEVHSFPYSIARRFIFVPHYDQGIPREERFTHASPSGKLEILVDNPDAVQFIMQNKALILEMYAVTP